MAVPVLPDPSSAGHRLGSHFRQPAFLRAMARGYETHSPFLSFTAICSWRGGGFTLDPQPVQTTAPLSVAEVFALQISVASMRAAGSLPFSGLADAGLVKIEKALPKDKVRDLRRFMDCLYIGPLMPQVANSNMRTMHAALLPAFETAFLKTAAPAFPTP